MTQQLDEMRTTHDALVALNKKNPDRRFKAAIKVLGELKIREARRAYVNELVDLAAAEGRDDRLMAAAAVLTGQVTQPATQSLTWWRANGHDNPATPLGCRLLRVQEWKRFQGFHP